MKTTIIERTSTPKLPAVGQAWCHDSEDSDVYLRIDDEKGRLALDCDVYATYFYSVRLSTGDICYTHKDASIHLLEPVNGSVEFATIS